MVDWGRLLSGCRGNNLGRRFESCPPRSYKIKSGKELIIIPPGTPPKEALAIIHHRLGEEEFGDMK